MTDEMSDKNLPKLSHDDWCKLSQAFWRGNDCIGVDQNTRINYFLKSKIASTAQVEKSHTCIPVSIGELDEICSMCGRSC